MREHRQAIRAWLSLQPALLCDDAGATSGLSRTHLPLIEWALVARLLNQSLHNAESAETGLCCEMPPEIRLKTGLVPDCSLK
jgi:hypothetical protein